VSLRTFAVRFGPGADLCLGLEGFARANDLHAAFVLTCVGSLSRAAVRPAGVPATVFVEGDLEILSLVGTLSEDGPHLHLTIGDAACAVRGGHAQEGSIVRTTAEVVLGELDDVVFRRPIDPETGWDELVVEPRQRR
jgi:predicted DNA-binding protein with PD1-like motif